MRSAATDAGTILYRNVYGWFERVEPGLYQLTPAGRAALDQWGYCNPATQGGL